jgi:hypothetical protein
MFSIAFTDEPLEYPFDDARVPAAPGALTLGKTKEEFLANLSRWSKSDYESHWIHELKALCLGCPKIALVVSYDDRKVASNMEIWRVYRGREWARFQNQLLPCTSLPDDFEVLDMSRYIPDRIVTTAEGHRISEWDVAMRDIESFLQRCNVL